VDFVDDADCLSVFLYVEGREGEESIGPVL
jgi:hypothetical protein